jgi:hypothetical protein
VGRYGVHNFLRPVRRDDDDCDGEHDGDDD